MKLAELVPFVRLKGEGKPALHAGLEPYPGYRLRRFLGQGGCGEVWEAETPNGPEALKLMRCGTGHLATEEMRSLQLMRPLHHPNLIRIDRVWAYQDYLVVAMELATTSLEHLFRSYRAEVGIPILPRHVCTALAQAAAALDFCNRHQHLVNGRRLGVQHCDVKPSNLLLVGNKVKLSDYGLASGLSAARKAHRRAGTPGFAAPEVFRGELSDTTDQYALAVSYCWLRSGRLPFPATPGAFAPNHVPPQPDLSMLSAREQPPVARSLSASPEERWPSCGELATRLREAVSS
jgi:serine/threonine protein kinase